MPQHAGAESGLASKMLSSTDMAGSSARVLCVDDDAEALERLRALLVRRGYEVCTATSAIEATDLVKRWTPAAAIINPLLPPADGVGVVERVARLNPGMAVLLLSDREHATAAAARGGGAGVTGLLTKPLDPREIEQSLAAAGVRPARAGRPPQPEPGAAAEAGRRRVLVVDDEVDIREILAEYLCRRGFDVAQAAGGEEALAVIPVFLPHLVLLDLVMPGLDGLATLRRIKALPVETAVVIISANDEVELGQLTLAIGAAGYVPKPVDFNYLDAALGSPCSAGTGSPAAPDA